MKNILDLPYQKADFYRIKKIVEAKLQQEDELGIDLSHMAPENRKVCLNALSKNTYKRPYNNPNNSKNQNSNPNTNHLNPNNPSYKGGQKYKTPKNKKAKVNR